jgi:hypothetical protein
MQLYAEGKVYPEGAFGVFRIKQRVDFAMISSVTIDEYLLDVLFD